MSTDSKSQPSSRPSFLAGVIVSALVAGLVSGIVTVAINTGWFPFVSIYAAGVPSTVQVIDSVEINTVEEMEIVVDTLLASEELIVRVATQRPGDSEVAAPGTANFGTQAESRVTAIRDGGTEVRFPIRKPTDGRATYRIEVVKANGGGPHDRRSLTVTFRAPAAPNPPGGVTPPTP